MVILATKNLENNFQKTNKKRSKSDYIILLGIGMDKKDKIVQAV